jgi:hypothetical protein
MDAQNIASHNYYPWEAAVKRGFSALLGFGLLGVMALPTFADIFWVSPAGVTALQPSGLFRSRPDGKGFYLRGRIVIQRDSADQPSLKFPVKYFMFEPYKSANTYGAARQLEWAWVASAKQEIDTLDDLRSILSNRDKQYGSWEAAFDELIVEIDPDDTIYHVRLKGKVAPQVVNSGIARREGYLSRDLISGHQVNTGEKQAYLYKKQHGMSPLDPLSYSPIDPLLRSDNGRNTIVELLEAIARAEKYGEPEIGFLEAARQVARFICEDVYPPPDALSGPSKDKAIFILANVANTRNALFGAAVDTDPDRLSDRLTKPGKFGSSLNDKLLYTNSYIQVDDALAINVFDVARAAIEVMEGLRTRREQDEGELVRTLLFAASGRSDFQSIRGQADFDAVLRARGYHASQLPAEVQPMEDSVGKLAFDAIIALAAAPRDRGQFAAELTENITDPDSGVRAAASEAVIQAGIGKATDITKLIDSYWEIGLSGMDSMDRKVDGSLPRTVAAINVLKRAGPAIKDPGLRTLYQQYLTKKTKQTEKRVEVGTASREERRWLDLLK